MTELSDDFGTGNLGRERLTHLLELLAQRGLTQQQIAARTLLNPQYLSDLKHGRRAMTELAARRIGDEFRVNHEWLLGTASTMEPGPARGGVLAPGPAGTWLPIFAHPVEGEPHTHPQWAGIGIEVAGVAAMNVAHARWPYVLRFDRDDVRDRLREGDLILISQAPSEKAEISVVSYRKKLFLARRHEEGGWERAANGDRLPSHVPSPDIASE